MPVARIATGLLSDLTLFLTYYLKGITAVMRESVRRVKEFSTSDFNEKACSESKLNLTRLNLKFYDASTEIDFFVSSLYKYSFIHFGGRWID